MLAAFREEEKGDLKRFETLCMLARESKQNGKEMNAQHVLAFLIKMIETSCKSATTE